MWMNCKPADALLVHTSTVRASNFCVVTPGRPNRTRTDTLKDVGAAIAHRSWLRLAIGFLIGFCLVGLQASIVGVVGHVRWVRSPEVGFNATGTALAAYLVLSCREELAFRGYPLRRLDCFFGPYMAQLLIALLFAVEHVAGGYSWINAMLGVATGSLLFGMAALATRGLAMPIGLPPPRPITASTSFS